MRLPQELRVLLRFEVLSLRHNSAENGQHSAVCRGVVGAKASLGTELGAERFDLRADHGKIDVPQRYQAGGSLAHGLHEASDRIFNRLELAVLKLRQHAALRLEYRRRSALSF